jgi:hypothetical protein
MGELSQEEQKKVVRLAFKALLPEFKAAVKRVEQKWGEPKK